MSIGISGPQGGSGILETQEALQKTLRALSSGKRINSAADDAAGLAISQNLRAAERTHSQGLRNLSDGISLSRVADGAVGQQSELVGRMKELAIQAGNGALSDSQKQAIQGEFDQLAQEVDRISNSTEFNGRQLLNGEAAGAGAITLRDGTGGPDDVLQISIDEQSASALGVQGLDVTDGSTLEALDRALSQLSSARADLGTAENRLTSGIRNLRTMRDNEIDAASRIADADYAKQSADNVKNQVQLNVQVATQAQSNISASLALNLLK